MEKLIYIYFKVLKKLRGIASAGSYIHKTSKVESGSSIVNTRFDKHSFCGYNCEISNTEVGSFCSIANGVIIGGGAHPMEWVSTSPVFYEGRDSVKAKFSEHSRKTPMMVTIGHDVWIGQNTLIKQGVCIGTGAVIGMGSVVTRNVQAYSVVAGNPAKLIRSRFDSQTIKRLLLSKWWELDEKELARCSKHIKTPSIFLDEITK